MDKKTLLSLFKYYKGENDNPYMDNKNACMWWYGEESLMSLCNGNWEKFDDIKKMLEEAITKGHVSDMLIDESIGIDKRTIVFYLDLWHGKHFPYNSLDEIFNY